MKPIVALEFSDLFKTDDGTDDSLLDDYDWAHKGASFVPDPIGMFLKKAAQDALGKGVGGVSDCSWDTPMVTPLNEAFDKACSSAQSAVEQFVKSNKHFLGSERLNCSELLKSFREERKCQHRR